MGTRKIWPLSCTTGAGFDAFVAALSEAAAAQLQPFGTPALTRARHRSVLTACAEALARYPLAAAPELAAEELRLAVRALARITGRVDVEDLLDVIFSEFCIGK